MKYTGERGLCVGVGICFSLLLFLLLFLTFLLVFNKVAHLRWCASFISRFNIHNNLLKRFVFVSTFNCEKSIDWIEMLRQQQQQQKHNNQSQPSILIKCVCVRSPSTLWDGNIQIFIEQSRDGSLNVSIQLILSSSHSHFAQLARTRVQFR